MVRQEYRSYAHPLKFPQKSTKKLLKLEKYLMREKFLHHFNTWTNAITSSTYNPKI